MTRYEPRYRNPDHGTGATTPALASATPTDPAAESECALRRALHRLHFTRRQPNAPRAFSRVPPPSQARLDESLNEQPLDIKNITYADTAGIGEKTVFYLAYGSNLCNETFRGRRGIKPISQINVVVPELRLTFDLPGIPYMEPCFANTALRDPSASSTTNENVAGQDYHKDRWHKGLVGCVYEVTMSDYAHIIATEGGGASYQDVLVECYILPPDVDVVPEFPRTASFRAHTLFAPIDPDASSCATTRIHDGNRLARPDPSYAQPSARYLKLINDGATELSLPAEYKAYLDQIRPYTITTTRQSLGQKMFVGFWMPFLFFVFGLQKQFQDDKGRSPRWLVVLSGYLFTTMWMSYDTSAKKVFGDGERTEGLDDDSMESPPGGSGSRFWRPEGKIEEQEKMLV